MAPALADSLVAPAAQADVAARVLAAVAALVSLAVRQAPESSFPIGIQ